MANERILLIDDDPVILKAINAGLKREQFIVSTVKSGDEALILLTENKYDVIILDLLMPMIDGFELLSRIRGNKDYTPVIVISGKDAEHDKILALGLGADDYITKPFSIHFLNSKLKALIRRNNMYQEETSSELIVGPFRMDKDTLKIYKGSELIELTAKEKLLLKIFLEHPNRVYTKEQLYELVWNDAVVDDNTIMVYVKRLREKIEEDKKKPKYLKTVWGIGYQFSV
ncbi:MAG: response regulator transcription factor [bacterium]|nr:response regulator transcription factor [bacterium]